MINGTLCAVLLFPTLSSAETLEGRITGITDGDSITIMVDRTEVKVRLSEIDAPERKQAFGSRAKQALSDLCFGQVARVESTGREHRKRVIGRVYCAGVDANAEMVRLGYAWVYREYATDAGLYTLQYAAQAARAGLWADAEPVAPWEFRKARRDSARHPLLKEPDRR